MIVIHLVKMISWKYWKNLINDEKRAALCTLAYARQLVLQCARRAHVLKGESRVFCKLYQLASESLVKVIASEPCSEPPMLLGDRLC